MTRVFLEAETTIAENLTYKQANLLIEEIRRRDMPCMGGKALSMRGSAGSDGLWSVVSSDLELQRTFINGGFENNPTVFEWDEESKSWGYDKRF